MWLTFAWVAQAHAQQMSLEEFGQSQGLQNLAVTSLAQDGSDFVWAGTENGVYRFDGGRFQRVTGDDPPLSVRALAADGQRMWVAADAGLWLWQDDRLVRVGVGDPPLKFGHHPQMLAPDGAGGVWLISHWRLARIVPAVGGGWRQADVLDGPPESPRGDPAAVTSVLATADGELWFGCGLALCQRQGGRLVRWGPAQGVPAEAWHRLMRASDGSMWARGARHVVQLVPGALRFSDRTDDRDEVDPRGRYPLVEDAQHRIVSAARGALTRWNGDAWHRFGSAAGLPAGGRLAALLPDRAGGLWLGMMGAGALKWRGYGLWENWSVADGLPHAAVWRFARAGPATGATMYAATGAGVAALDPVAGVFRPLPDTAHQDVQALASDAGGTLWSETRQARLLRLAAPDGHGGPVVSIGLAGASKIFGIVAQRSGVLWVFSDAGVHRRPADVTDVASAAVVPVVAGGRPGGESFSRACEDASGGMWFAGTEGVTRYAEGAWTRAFEAAKGIAEIACLRDGRLAVSSGTDGIHLLVKEAGGLRDHDVTPPALRGRNILALMEDRRGWLWANTDFGVAVWNRQQWRLLDQSRGLVWNDTSGGALFEDQDGSIWIGTSRGASHMLAPDALFAPVESRVAIRAITRGGLALTATRPGHLPWSNDPLQIDLAVPVVSDLSALAVEYRLKGFDDRWRETSHLDVSLTGLPPSLYHFEARVVDRELAIPSPSTGFDVEIDPPWWRSRAAIAVGFFLTLALAAGLFRWRVRLITGRAERLEVLVAERTRELEDSREQMRELATKDSLTGVWNRGALTDILATEANRCAREQVPLTVVMADIDHFKRVNDTHGHPAGDAVLREFAGRLVAAIRPYDAVGRYGGEEFVIVMPNLDIGQADQRERLTAIHAAIAAVPMSIGTVTCSFGVASTNGRGPVDVDALIARADAALYRAKGHGRDRIEWAESS